MGKAKGLSFAEKQERLLKAMRASNECFIYKEIESLAKKVGIIPQAAKEVLQSLVDDDLVQQDKVGLQNVYWSLASDAGRCLENALQAIREKEEKLEGELGNWKKHLKKLQGAEKANHKKTQEDDSPETFQKLEKELSSINEQIDFYEKNSPERIKLITKELEIANQALLRWEDNICVARQWIKNRSGMSEKSINAQFGINDEAEEGSVSPGCDECIEAF